MDNAQETPEILRVSRRSVYGILLALITMATAVIVSYINNRPNTAIDAPDRYTGTEGRTHEARTLVLEQRLRSLEQTKGIALGRISKLEIGKDNWDKEFRDHIAWNQQMVREFSISDAKTAVKLDECLHRTGLK